MNQQNDEFSFEAVANEIQNPKGDESAQMKGASKERIGPKLRMALGFIPIVILVGAFLSSGNEQFSHWVDGVLSDSTDPQALEQQIDFDAMEDINQGPLIELVKAEALEYTQARGGDTNNVRKSISLVFPDDPAMWAKLDDSILFGDANDPTLFYIFADPGCPACIALENELLQYKGKPLSYRVLPISGQGKTVDLISEIMCAENTSAAWVSALTSPETEIQVKADCTTFNAHERNRLVFDALGLNSTPSIWMPANNRIVKDGVPSAADLRKLADAPPL